MKRLGYVMFPTVKYISMLIVIRIDDIEIQDLS